ncbi:hypothetical protein SDC9_113229 [bioreactor metagenome]|uniref:Uncharacterized protein n=1 Tax=bioreactor metagenome TaxID=1076179 RepID=A0A645BMB3_9ZZZZ
MRYVVFRHGENRNHRDGTRVATDSARSFIHAGKVGIQIAGVAAPSGDFFSGSGDFAKGFCVIRNVRDDNQHVHAKLICQIFRCGDRHARGRDAFDGGIIREIDKRNRLFNCARLSKIADEEIRFFKRDADRGKHDGEILIRAKHPCLARNLRGEVSMRQAGAGEHRQFLSANQRVEPVDRGDTRLNELAGVISRGGVHGRTVDVQVLFRNQRRPFVDGLAHAVKDSAEHIGSNVQLNALAEKSCLRGADL